MWRKFRIRARVARALRLWLAAFALAGLLSAGDTTRWLYRSSVAALIGSNTADVVTSLQLQGRPGVQETGWMYGARFDGRAIGIKAALVGGQLLIQHVILRRHPRLRPVFTVSNFTQAAAPARAAFRNGRLH